MKTRLCLLGAFLGITSGVWADTGVFRGRILEKNKKTPVEFATVWVQTSNGVGAVTDASGFFQIAHLPEGENTIVCSCLGYSSQTLKVNIGEKNDLVTIYLPEMSLALDEVTVTAQRKSNEATTAYTIDRTGLDHMQAVSVAEVLSLLPGEQTKASFKLTGSRQSLSVRGGGSQEMGYANFGTAIEMDGVRLSSNGIYSTDAGSPVTPTDIRNVGSSNIESVEVITGVPSVEYGDLTNGVVRIKTFRGKTPFRVEVGVRPNTQQYAISKGLDLGGKRGVLNLSYERAHSVADLASPYTAYNRNALTMKYSNTFRTHRGKQVDLDWNINGNVGGQHSKSDPDAFRETYTKNRDYAVRSGLSVDYMVNAPWLSHLSAGVSFAYSDNLMEDKKNYSAASTLPALHVTEEGYFVAQRYDDNPSAPIILQPVGYWYATEYNDNKPVSYGAYLKAKWAHRFSCFNSNTLLGGELQGDGNWGTGTYYDDMRTAPTWREYRYDKLPFTNNLSVYAEEELKVNFEASHLMLKAGLRGDWTFIKGSEYGTVGSLSPRLNMSYTFAEHPDGWLRGVTLRAGWGKAVKLPSFALLYPRTTYRDVLAFAPGTMADGTTYYAYYTHLNKLQYNRDLRWQYNIMRELGVDMRFKGVRLSLSFYHNTTKAPYTQVDSYTPFDYKLTDQSALEGCVIPSADRVYHMDPQTGIVSVSDKRGVHPTQSLAYRTLHDWQNSRISVNGSSFTRTGLEWVLDFDKIPALNTSVRIDGKYYRYRGVDETITQSTSSVKMTNGQPYKYVGYYVGGTGNYNGYQSERLNANLIVMTHIPRIRMILSLRIEGTFIHSGRYLSEYGQGDRSYAIDDRESYLPSATGGSIYEGGRYTVTYPLYYVSNDDLNTKIPFKEKFLWAYEHDRSLYNDLSKLVVRSNYGYLFNKQGYSPYFSGNLNVTKEIGDHITVAFYANNFFDSMRKIKNKQTGLEEVLFDSGYISSFNYGISLKLKL